MIRIVKGDEPQCLLEWKEQETPDWKATYDGFRDKDKLRAALLEEQGGLCCYCGREAKFKDSHIEHFKPQSRYSDLEIKYDNLHASCVKSPAPGGIRHCGHAKNDCFDENLYISPLEEDCEEQFLYTLEGEIQPKNMHDKKAEHMIKILNLNAPPLRGRRKEVLIRTFPPEILNNLSHEKLQNFRATCQERDSKGHFQEFRQVLSRYIDQNMPQMSPLSDDT